MDTALNDGCRAMASDKARETEAAEWCDALAGDVAQVIFGMDAGKVQQFKPCLMRRMGRTMDLIG